MIDHYYAAFDARDGDPFGGVLGKRWFSREEPPPRPIRRVERYLDEIEGYVAGIPDTALAIDSLHFADKLVTVIGMLTSTHTGEVCGCAATSRSIKFSAIAVHRLADSAIAESWQIPDRPTLIEQINYPKEKN